MPKIRSLFRAAVSCAVLTALLFSCGEGIRLLPFPHVEASKSECSRLNSGEKIAYQHNAPRFEDDQGNQKTKFQKSPQHRWIENKTPIVTAFPVAVGGKPLRYSTAFADLKRLLFSEPGESRAPPLAA